MSRVSYLCLDGVFDLLVRMSYQTLNSIDQLVAWRSTNMDLHSRKPDRAPPNQVAKHAALVCFIVAAGLLIASLSTAAPMSRPGSSIWQSQAALAR